MKRLVALLPVLIAFQAGAPPALAWTWPAEGPVLRPFVLGEDPYVGGQHRGVDIAGDEGAPVRSPAAGVVSFAGTVPASGRAVTVKTEDGYSVTLVHLGSIAVDRDAVLREGAPVGTIGPSGDIEHPVPYVHLGIRVTADANGYLDPLSFLPTRERSAPAAPEPPVEPVPAVPPTPVPEAPAPPPEAPAQESPAPAPEAPTPALEAPAPAPALEAPAPAPAPEAPAPAPEHERAAPERESNRPGADAGATVLAGAREEAERVSRERSTADEGREEADGVSGADASRPVWHAVSGSHPAPALTSTRPRVSADEAVSRATAPGGHLKIPVLAAAAVILCLVATAALRLVRCRQLGHAAMTDAPPPVLDDRACRAAEDAGALGAAQEDGLVLDRDLERVALGEPEPLPDLDRDHDPTELIQMANDACRRRPALVSLGRFHRVGPRPSSHCRRAKTVSAC
jgi:Peptidase family M23